MATLRSLEDGGAMRSLGALEPFRLGYLLQNRVKLMDAGEVAWRRLTAYAVLCLSGWNLPPST